MFLPKNLDNSINSQKKKLYFAFLFCTFSLLVFSTQLNKLRAWNEGELTRVRVVLHDQVQEQQERFQGRFCEVLPNKLQEVACPDFYAGATSDRWCGNDSYFN